MFIDLDTLCTLDPLSILRNDSSRFYQSRHVGAHSGTGAPLEDNPLGWGGNFVKLFTALLSPLRLRLSFPTPLQLAAVLLPLCSWALLLSTAAVTSCQISHRAGTALAAPLCANTLHSWFFSLHWSCLFSWLILICSISRCTWKPCLY